MKKPKKKLLARQISYYPEPAGVPKTITVEQLVAKTAHQLDSRCLDKAEFYAKQLVVAAPGLFDGQLYLLKCSVNKCAWDQAYQALQAALALGQNSPELFLYGAIVLRERNDIPEALRLIARGATLYPRNVRLRREHEICQSCLNPGKDQPEMPAIAICTTLRRSQRVLDSFLSYHLAHGFDHIFLFFDEPGDPAIEIAAAYPNVTIIPCDDSVRSRWQELRLYQEYGPQIGKEVMARQVLNVELCIRECLNMGIDWLLHIDDDELFYSPDQAPKAHFKSLSDRGVTHASYFNHEAVVVDPDITDYFRRATLFKRNRRLRTDMSKESQALLKSIPQLSNQFFFFYSNGKSAARVSEGLVPDGAHRFKVPDPVWYGAYQSPEMPIILHYPCCGFDNFLNKYHNRGAFQDKWFGKIDIRSAIGNFHLDARDIVGSGDLDKIREFYLSRGVIQDQKQLTQLVNSGLVVEIGKPAEELEKLLSH